MVKEEERPQENAKLHLIFIYKQHRWLQRNLCSLGVERSLTGISNVYAGYEQESRCLMVVNHSSVH